MFKQNVQTFLLNKDCWSPIQRFIAHRHQFAVKVRQFKCAIYAPHASKSEVGTKTNLDKTEIIAINFHYALPPSTLHEFPLWTDSCPKAKIFVSYSFSRATTEGCHALSSVVIIVRSMPETSNQVKAVWRLWRCWSVKQFRVLPRNSILLALAIHLIGWSEEQVWVFCFIGGPWCFRTDVLSLDNNQKCCFRRYLTPLFPLLRVRYTYIWSRFDEVVQRLAFQFC